MASVVLVCSFTLAVVFFVSAGSKLRGRAAFDAFRTWYTALPLPFARQSWAAWTLPGAELATAVLLIWPGTRAVGLAAAALLLVALTAGVGHLLRQESKHACQCFGKEPTTLRPRHLVRNLGLLGLAAGGSAAGIPHAAPPTAGQTAGAMAAGLVGALFIIFFDDFADLLAGGRLEALPSEDHR